MAVETTAWPEQKEVKALICAYFLLVLTILTALCTTRISSIGSFRSFRKISIARKLILFTLLDSWLFCYASALLLFGIGSALNARTCAVGIWWCILLYASSKVMIYMFLMERLHLVHSTTKHDATDWKDRCKSWWYRIAAVLLLGWIAVGIVMCIGRNATLKGDGECKIGLKVYATVPMLTVDAIVNIFLTVGFVYPVWKAGFASAKGLVKDSCFAATAALLTSFANIAVLAAMKGHQMSYICLSSCVFDVAANAAILWFITRRGSRSESELSAAGADSRRGGTSKTYYSTQKPATSRKGSFATGSRFRQHDASGTFEGVTIARVQHSVVDLPDETSPTFFISYDCPALPEVAASAEAASTRSTSPLGTPVRERLSVQFGEETKESV